MIHFNRETLNTALYWNGGIVSHVSKPVLCYFVYLAVMVGVENVAGNWDIYINRSSLGMIMHFLVFLLVFRVNATQTGHQRVAFEVNLFFSKIESFLELTCTTLRGPKAEDPPEVQRAYTELAVAAKLNLIRMSLALAISFVFHCVNITAVMEMQGEMNEESLQDLLFLRHRLQGLLYHNEMTLVDRAICIIQEAQPQRQANNGESWWSKAWLKSPTESCDDPQPVYRSGKASSESCGLLIGAAGRLLHPEEDSEIGVHMGHLPKVIMPMLLNAVCHSVGQPWGFDERTWSLMSRYMRGLKLSISIIHTMTATPTPMPYVQLAHLLVMIFAVFYPMTLNIRAGVVDVIIMPLLLYFTIQAFDVLAKMLESATGHDCTDLNFMELIHNLELQAKYAFECTADAEGELRESLHLPAWSFDLESVKQMSSPVKSPELAQDFGEYFQWVPMPTVILETLFQAHGHAEGIAQVAKVTGRMKFRKLLRAAMRRVNMEDLTRSMEDPEEVQETEEAVRLIRQDPNIFSHYLVFRGVYDPARNEAAKATSSGSGDLSAHVHWKEHVGGIVADHTAGRLFGYDPNDTARSTVTSFGDVWNGHAQRVRAQEPAQEPEHPRQSHSRMSSKASLQSTRSVATSARPAAGRSQGGPLSSQAPTQQQQQQQQQPLQPLQQQQHHHHHRHHHHRAAQSNSTHPAGQQQHTPATTAPLAAGTSGHPPGHQPSAVTSHPSQATVDHQSGPEHDVHAAPAHAAVTVTQPPGTTHPHPHPHPHPQPPGPGLGQHPHSRTVVANHSGPEHDLQTVPAHTAVAATQPPGTTHPCPQPQAPGPGAGQHPQHPQHPIHPHPHVAHHLGPEHGQHAVHAAVTVTQPSGTTPGPGHGQHQHQHLEHDLHAARAAIAQSSGTTRPQPQQHQHLEHDLHAAHAACASIAQSSGTTRPQPQHQHLEHDLHAAHASIAQSSGTTHPQPQHQPLEHDLHAAHAACASIAQSSGTTRAQPHPHPQPQPPGTGPRLEQHPHTRAVVAQPPNPPGPEHDQQAAHAAVTVTVTQPPGSTQHQPQPQPQPPGPCLRQHPHARAVVAQPPGLEHDQHADAAEAAATVTPQPHPSGMDAVTRAPSTGDHTAAARRRSAGAQDAQAIQRAVSHPPARRQTSPGVPQATLSQSPSPGRRARRRAHAPTSVVARDATAWRLGVPTLVQDSASQTAVLVPTASPVLGGAFTAQAEAAPAQPSIPSIARHQRSAALAGQSTSSESPERRARVVAQRQLLRVPSVQESAGLAGIAAGLPSAPSVARPRTASADQPRTSASGVIAFAQGSSHEVILPTQLAQPRPRTAEDNLTGSSASSHALPRIQQAALRTQETTPAAISQAAHVHGSTVNPSLGTLSARERLATVAGDRLARSRSCPAVNRMAAAEENDALEFAAASGSAVRAARWGRYAGVRPGPG